MTRSFRFYEKKRGNRRTGSPALGSMGEALFWAVFLLLGCAGIVMMLLTIVVPEWRVNHEFVETKCNVLDKRIAEKPGEDGQLYRPEIRIEYEVDGVTYRDWHYDVHRAFTSDKADSQEVVDSFAKGDSRTCWYDPMKPNVAVLVRGYRWWIWLVFIVPVSFFTIGAGGLLYTVLRWGKSAERRSALSQRSAERDYLGHETVGQPAYPSVPQGVDMTNSPGTRLRFRLPMAMSPGWALFGILAACVFWNGIVSVFVVIAVRGHLAGQPEWLLTVFVIPFVLIGFVLIYQFFRQLLTATGVGPTLMEISDHPLSPGGQYRLFLSQSGRLMVNSIRVSLLCEESATYRQGTNTRTETQEVFRQPVFVREGFSIESGLPLETEVELNVPEGAMHSFKSDHNEVNWILLVEGDVASWPDYKRRFSVIVRPSAGETAQ